MKKSLVLLTLGIVAIVTFPVVALADEPATGLAWMQSTDGSGINGIITFLDNGTDLFVRGTATGMDLTEIYASLIYDTGSFHAGPDACKVTPGADPIPMFVGTWVVHAGGNGELDAVNVSGQFVSLEDFRTISIRRKVDDAFPVVEACGVVVVHEIDD